MIDFECNEATSSPIPSATEYRDLYRKELERNRTLSSELEITRAESKMFSRELSNLFLHSKTKRRELAIANNQLVRYASDLRETVTELRKAHHELQDAYRDTIFRLVLASEYKDKDTGNHLSRMSRYCMVIARHMKLPEKQIEDISYAAPMHDVGKIGIPDNIILKKGMLSENEFSIVKSHTTIGADILNDARGTVLQTARIIALSHHEHWDGGGYPQGLSGQDIPLAARIVAVTDTFDALTSYRPYKNPYPIDISCEIIKAGRENHFDPEIVDLFLDAIDELVAIKGEVDQKEPDADTTSVRLSERDERAFKGRFPL